MKNMIFCVFDIFKPTGKGNKIGREDRFFQFSLGLNSPPGSCAVEVATKTALARYKNEEGSAQE